VRYITADYIFPITSPPIQNGTVVIEDNGTIIEVQTSEIKNQQSEIYQGIVCPGFINAHCHLELSHLKNSITEKKGLTGFIDELVEKRSRIEERFIAKSMSKADEEMFQNGIVAVGDISNNTVSIVQKLKSKILYHTFIEVFDLNPSHSMEVFANALLLETVFDVEYALRNSIAPHAPYTVSPPLMKMIADHAKQKKSLLTLHNQESATENKLFEKKSGKLFDYFKSLNIPLDHLPLTRKSSLQSVLPSLPKENKILLVHNTYTEQEDIQFAHGYSKNIYWCFCPNANLFIENTLPDYKAFIEESCKCCLGTDSYASNHSLSILDEMKTITKDDSSITLETLLKWATFNGAEFFGIENQFGSLEKNKKPGLNLIENADFKFMRLTEKSSVKKLA
jgi:cytosine/adenosine deaminase-related metal-dependent hydrolase